MSILFCWENGDAELWRNEFSSRLPDREFNVHPDVRSIYDVQYILTWMPPIGDLKRYPNLKAIFSIGAGCDHILRDPEVPRDIPIVRLIDDASVRDMSHFALHWALHFQRNFHIYAKQQRIRRWQRQPYHTVDEHCVGVLGLGGMGTPIARLVVTAPEFQALSIPLHAGTDVNQKGMFGRLGAALRYMIWGSSS